MGKFTFLYITITLAPGWGLCRQPSVTASTQHSRVTHLSWHQIQEHSARDFWKEPLCWLLAMFMCNQTKVNGRILPRNTTKQSFIILRGVPQGLWTPYPHTIWQPSVEFPLCRVSSCIQPLCTVAHLQHWAASSCKMYTRHRHWQRSRSIHSQICRQNVLW